MKFATTIIANSFNFSRSQYTFNCSTNLYMTAGMNRCWYGAMQQIELPIQMGGDMNLTYNGTRIVDGWDCMVFVSAGGTYYAVRLKDLAIVEIDLPYLIGELAPYFNFFGFGSALSRISLFNIVTGPPNPSNFNVPAGACLEVYNTTMDYRKIKDRPFENLFKNPVAEIIKDLAKKTIFRDFLPKNVEKPKLMKKRDIQQPNPPHLNQTFAANWIMNASATLPPFTAYTLSGTLAFDFSVSGFYISLDTITGNIPFDLKVALVISPDRNGVDFLQEGPDGSCYSYLYLQYIWTYLVPIFEIPYTSVYLGTIKVNGDTCSAWQTTWNWYQNFAVLYVRESDNVLVQSLVPDPVSFAPNFFTISQVQGSVPPSIYARPNTCAEILDWSNNFEAHLPWAWCYPYC